jgi:Phosphoenolpyruvate phosphomutase
VQQCRKEEARRSIDGVHDPSHRAHRDETSGGSQWGDRRRSTIAERETEWSGKKHAEARRTLMSQLLREKRDQFRKLHESGCFVLPNPWDVGSARMLEHLGFVALASTSAGFAWSIGRPDYVLPRGEVLAHQ